MEPKNAIVTFDPKAVGNFGNQMLNILIQHEDAKEAAETALQQANEREKVIDFELTRVALFLHGEEKIDLYAVYEESRDATSKLYRSILTETGVLSRTIDDATDKVLYDFTDKSLKGSFDFDAAIANYKHDPEKEEKPSYTSEQVEEEKKKRSRRNALNIRLARVCKAALALSEAKATPDNMVIEQADDGTLSAVINKGPSEVMGKEGTVQIHGKSVKPVEGATATPTVTGLAKLSDTKHKKAKETSKQDTETTTRKSGEGADVIATLNAALMVVKGLEGKPANKEQETALKNLLTEIKKCVK